MLLIIAVIAILAGIVIIAINPGRQLAQARNVQRSSDIKAIYNAVNHYYIDNKAWPSNLETFTTLTEICNTGTATSGHSIDCTTDNLVDLSVLVPTFISAIPTDPQITASLPFTNNVYAQTVTNGTGYMISINQFNQAVVLLATRSEEYDLEKVYIGNIEEVSTHTIDFDNQGGIPASDVITGVQYNTVVTLPAEPTRNGYAFLHWNTEIDGSGTSYNSGQSFTMPASNVTLYAIWSINQYTLTFDTDGGSSISPITQNYNTTITPPSDPTKSGHAFNGWSPSIPSIMPANNQTHTAQWQEIVANVTWDANGSTAGQTDGLGVWLNTGRWWNGTTNVNWTSGDNAIFGNGGVGGAVTLASPTTVNLLTLNSFSGTYTLGTAGQAITLNNGITKNSGSAGAVNIISPFILTGPQTWLNNSAGTLTVSGTKDNGGNLLTINGTGTISFGTLGGILSGGGGLTKKGPGWFMLGSGGTVPIHTYTGPTTINGGVLMQSSNNIPSGNIILNGGVLESYWSTNFTRTLGSGTNQIQIPGGVSGFSLNGATGMSVILNNSAAYEVVWGSTHFNPSTFVLQSPLAQNSSSLNFQNKIDLNGSTRNILVNKTTGTGTGNAIISGIIRDSVGGAGLTKIGDGTLRLTATNTYTGPVTVSAGTLQFTTAVPVSNDWNVSISSSTTKGLMTLPNNPNLTGKVINISTSAVDNNYSVDLVTWTGTAVGTPTLKINGNIVTSGVFYGSDKVTFNANAITFTR